MELLVLGHAGNRVLVFPTSMGRFHDWEDRGLVRSLAGTIEAGRYQLVCVDSVDQESWYARDRHPAERAARHNQYDEYIFQEVLPFSAHLNPDPFVIVAGASFGGYHAVNFGLRHPEQVGRVLGMSGLYDIHRFTDGYSNETIYFHNPCEFIANEHDQRRLEALRRLDIILAVGREDGLRESNERLSAVLWTKDIWHALRLWDGFAHDWPVWEHMLQLYLGGHD
jgi:esterase/lipase superfamily enzyme